MKKNYSDTENNIKIPLTLKELTNVKSMIKQKSSAFENQTNKFYNVKTYRGVIFYKSISKL